MSRYVGFITYRGVSMAVRVRMRDGRVRGFELRLPGSGPLTAHAVAQRFTPGHSVETFRVTLEIVDRVAALVDSLPSHITETTCTPSR